MIENIKNMTEKQVAEALCRYIDYSSVFGPAQAVLAGQLANCEVLGVNRMKIAKSVFMGALDEFMDNEHGGATHRELAERMRVALGHFGDNTVKCRDLFKVAGYSNYDINLGAAAFALGWHNAVEELADIEYNLIDRLLKDHHPNMVAYLKACDAYAWIERHTVADAKHLEYSNAGLELLPEHLRDDVDVGFNAMHILEAETLDWIFKV